MNNLKKLLVLMFVSVVATCFSGTTAKAANETQTIRAEIVDLSTVFEDTNNGLSSFSIENGTVDLNAGNYEKWIDRIDVPEYAHNLYDTLVEYCDNDGIDDLLINDSGFAKETATVIDFGSAYGSDSFHAIEYVTLTNPTQEEINYVYRTMRVIFEAFDMDHPEVFWLSGVTSGYGLIKGSDYTFYFLIKMHEDSYSNAFDVRAEEYKASGTIEKNITIRDEAIETILNTDAVKNASNDYETVKALNEWLVMNNEYNYDVILNPPAGRTIAHRCISALTGSAGLNGPVCEGYSKAFKVLCDELGIPCVVTIGKAYGTPGGEPEAHSWNGVRIDGVWYWTDITWNDPVVLEVPGVVSGYEHNEYLLVGYETEIYGVKFKDSHIETNILSTNGLPFMNSPIYSPEAYVKQEIVKPEASNDVIRLAGTTRYETSLAIAEKYKEKTGVNKFNAVIIASGKNFADALAGSYLASQTNAPILMTNGKSTVDLRNFIANNLTKGGTIYLLGGSAAVPETIETALAGLGTITRLSGSSRYDTNLEILKEARVNNEEILVCTGKTFADSLSASAAKKPILLVNNKSLTKAQKAFLAEHSDNKLYIIGGEGAVNKDLEEQLNAYGEIERISGKTRYETSVLFARKFFTDPTQAVLAYAKNFPDGLCGGALAMAMDAPLILTANAKEAAAAEYMQEYQISSGIVLGGERLISDDSAIMIFGLK